MKSLEEIQLRIDNFHNEGATIAAANFLLKEYGLENPNFKGFELREKATPDFILMTTEGIIGELQIIRIPENTFEFPLVLMLNLLAHEMVHVQQKAKDNPVTDKNEREWQAYYEMLFHQIFPQIPELSPFHIKFFARKALEYYSRMGENSDLQLQYKEQKTAVTTLLETIP